MQNMKNHNNNKYNKGFSLVEIIIAIAILGIIVLPLLQAFVTSSNMNANSKNKLMAIETAKNIMEQMKGYNLAEVTKLADSDITTDTIFGNGAFKELDYNITENKYTLIQQRSLRQNPASGKYDFYPKPSGKYYYFLQDINQGDFNTNALVTISKPSISADNISKITPIDTNKDIIIDSTVDAKDVADKIQNDPSLPDNIKKDATENSISREIHISIIDGDIPIIKTNYLYYVGDSTSPISDISDLKTEMSDSPKDELRSIYLFFEPWIHTVGEEKIVINNASNKKFNIYIVKQATGNPDTERILLDIKDGNINFASKSPVKVFTNLSESNFRYRYYRDGLPLSPESIDVKSTLVESKSTEELNSLARLYDIEVKIFNSNVDENSIESAKPLVTLTGGMSN